MTEIMTPILFHHLIFDIAQGGDDKLLVRRIKQAVAAYSALLDEVAQLRKENEWIAVSERLPEKETVVWVVFDNKVDLAWLDANNRWIYDDFDYQEIYYKVTHWMPQEEKPLPPALESPAPGGAEADEREAGE